MYPEPIQKLIDLFSRFPGIGPRQAARFAFFILKEKNPFIGSAAEIPTARGGDKGGDRYSGVGGADSLPSNPALMPRPKGAGSGFIGELRAALEAAEERIGICNTCFRMMERENGDVRSCDICVNPRREAQIIAVVEKESDMRNLEQSGAYHGLYHVLGGVISPLDQESPKRIRLKELYERVEKCLTDAEACEVILATNPTTEGDTTARYIERVMAPLQSKHPALAISRLGRGLSLGSELEYADEITIKNAVQNRK